MNTPTTKTAWTKSVVCGFFKVIKNRAGKTKKRLVYVNLDTITEEYDEFGWKNRKGERMVTLQIVTANRKEIVRIVN